MNAKRQATDRWLLLVSLAVICWLGMQAAHELGHVVGAWAGGGEVRQVTLHPLTISRTDYARNPRPLLSVWAGPLLGVGFPLLAWGLAAALRLSGAFVLRIFAAFCLLANGLYIGLGSFGRVGDCGEMLRHGSAPWQLWLFGLLAAPLGLWLCHGQGPHFGLGPRAQEVDRRLALATFVVALVLLIVALAVDGR